MKSFGKVYAKQIVENSLILAKALHDYGFPVICQHLGFTRSHQVIANFGDYEKGRAVAEKLQNANIITDCVIRFGTCEVTRRGMKKSEMLKIAELIKRTILDKENPETIKKAVYRLVSEFERMEYCFDE
jgi:glycine hydroxymethyltransferase